DFAHTTAHELAFLRCHINGLPFQQGMADGHTIIKRGGDAQLSQVRAADALRRGQPLMKAVRVKQSLDALAGRTFQITAHDCVPCAWLRASASLAAWSRRRLTTAGVAPISLMSKWIPASGWRWCKSRTTASQIVENPRAEV